MVGGDGYAVVGVGSRDETGWEGLKLTGRPVLDLIGEALHRVVRALILFLMFQGIFHVLLDACLSTKVR